MMGPVLLSPRNMLDLLLSRGDLPVSVGSAIVATRFECGIILSALMPGLVNEVRFLPDFNRVWWRLPYRWARNFQYLSELEVEVKALGFRKVSPLFAVAASTFPRWGRIYDGRAADLEAHFEVILPDSELVLSAASRFISRWLDEFKICPGQVSPSSLPSDQVVFNALLSLPGHRADSEADELAAAALACIEDLFRVDWRQSDMCLPFPNIFEFQYIGHEPVRRLWMEVFDRRVELICEARRPEHYPSIQGLSSRNEWEREFVWEADVSKARGCALVGECRMRRLFDLGLRLESEYPVLSEDPFSEFRGFFDA